jgi:hypothetical protein
VNQVASCKDPPICWRCECSSHVSYQCSHKVIERRHCGNIQFLWKQRSLKKQTEDEAGSFSDVIHIIPQEHSMTMRQIEVWLGTVDRSRKTTPLFQLENIESNGTTISSSDAHSPESVSLRLAMKKLEPTNVSTEMRTWRQLWKSQHVDNSPSETNGEVATEKRATKISEQFFREAVPCSYAIHIIPLALKISEQFFREAVPCSDDIHIIPLASFSEKQKKITMGSRPCNKHTVSVMKHTNMQQSNDAVVPPIPAP